MFRQFLPKGQLNFWTEYSEPKNNCKKNFLSELQELEVQSKFGQNSQSSQIWVKLKTFEASRGKKDFLKSVFGFGIVRPELNLAF